MRQRENEDRRGDESRVGLAHQMLHMKPLCEMWAPNLLKPEENGWTGGSTTAHGGLVRWSWPRTEGREFRQHVRGWGMDRREGEAKEARASLTRSKSTKKWIRSLAIGRNGECEVWTCVEEIKTGSTINSFRSWAVQEMWETGWLLEGKELHLPKHTATIMLLTCLEPAITKACHLRSCDSSLPPVTSLHTSYGPLKPAQTHHSTKRYVTVDRRLEVGKSSEKCRIWRRDN